MIWIARASDHGYAMLKQEASMLIVGEEINTSRKSIAAAVEAQDADFISEVARNRAEAGAHCLYVNAGTFLLFVRHPAGQPRFWIRLTSI